MACTTPGPSPDAGPSDERGSLPGAVGAIQAELADLEAEGLAGVVRVSRRDEVLLHEAYGLRDRATDEPVTPTTGFDVGSITKVLTAATVLALAEEGALQLTDPVEVHVPELTGPVGDVTLGQLLDHTAGLPEYLGEDDDADADRAEALRRIRDAGLAFPPGTDESYSNAGYTLLAILVEEVAGRPFERVVADEVLAPAGTTGIGYVLPGWRREDLAVGYRRLLWLDRAWGTPLDRSWLADGPPWTLRGNGGLLATADLLARWFDALYDGDVLGPEALRTLYGLYGECTTGQERRIGEAGGNGVFNAVHESWVERDVHVTILTSTPVPGNAESVWDEISEEVDRLVAATPVSGAAVPCDATGAPGSGPSNPSRPTTTAS